MMFKKFVSGLVVAVALTAASAASAATLNLIGTGQTHTVTNNDILPGLNNTSIQMIDGSQKSSGNGLYLSLAGAAAEVTYTFMGAEAGHSNFGAVIGNAFLNRGWLASTPGDQATVTQHTSGFLDFAFGTYRPSWAVGLFNNNGAAIPGSANFAMGFVQLSSTAFYVMFDDIAAGDRDFDDMVMRIDVAAVPIPAGGLLLLSALGGVLVLRRKTSFA